MPLVELARERMLMAIVPWSVQPDEQPLPDEVNRLLRAATRRLEQFASDGTDVLVPAFVATDFELLYRVMSQLRIETPAANRFCEWGSGMGIVAMLASLLNFDSVGIEIEPQLVALSRELSAEFDVPVQWVQGSFLPPGAERLADEVDDLSWLDLSVTDAYQQIGLDVDDFDIIYAYPWPGERRLMLEIFDRYARPGACLISYHGAAEWHVWKKQGGQETGPHASRG